MSSESQKMEIKPVISLGIITITLFLIAIFHMEERRIGYQIYYLSKDFKKIEQIKRIKELELVKLYRPSHLMNVAQKKLTLKIPDNNQVIHLTTGVKVKN